VGGGAVSVAASTDIFGAGQPGGPPTIAVPPGSSVAIFDAPGSGLSCCSGAGAHSADGGANASTDVEPSPPIGISGIRHHELNIFLIGVFLDDKGPDPAATPPVLSYSSANGYAGTLWDGGDSFTPLINQTFFVGDGLTGTGAGNRQSFTVPSGATRLYLGFADGLNLGDYTHDLGTPSPATPGYYDDNTGAVTVTYAFH
jgi:hypothetical protein